MPVIRTFITARLAAKASPGEINRELACLKRMFTLAVHAGKLHGKPHIPMLREDNVRRGFFEPEQFAAVKAKLPAPLQPVVTFVYLTGWRLASRSPAGVAAGRLAGSYRCAWTPARRRIPKGGPFPSPRRSRPS